MEREELEDMKRREWEAEQDKRRGFLPEDVVCNGQEVNL